MQMNMTRRSGAVSSANYRHTLVATRDVANTPTKKSSRHKVTYSLLPFLVALSVSCHSGVENSLKPIPQGTEVLNSQRGMYSWLTMAPQIPGWRTVDVYWRDQIQWGAQVEKTRGAYDFSVFEKGLREAQKTNGRFSFRIMAMCPGCGGNLAPSYVAKQPNGAPDWNSEAFLAGYEQLMVALGSRFDKDPRLGIIDVGGYGLWGEWYCDDQCGMPITDTNVERLLRAVSRAFPSKYFALGFSEKPAELAAQINPKIGLRFDCIGGFPATLKYLPDRVKNVWRRAPVVGEWCPIPGSTATLGVDNVRELHVSMLSSANFVTPYDRLGSTEQAAFRQANILSGFRYAVSAIDAAPSASPGNAAAVTVTVQNLGVAPTYDVWTSRILLIDSDGIAVASAALPLDLRTLAEGATKSTAMLALPTTFPGGTYRIAIESTDGRGYLKPLAFANSGRDANGRYTIGSLDVRDG